MKLKLATYWLIALFVILLLSWSQVAAQSDSRTVIGPSNPLLADGADALLAGDGELGVRLTLQGLEVAKGNYEIRVGHANLCAGYTMVNKAEEALPHCNWVLQRHPNDWRACNNRALAYLQLGRYEESGADIRRGQEISPNAHKLKLTLGLLLDKIDPVMAMVEIDDRRNAPRDTTDDPGAQADD